MKGHRRSISDYVAALPDGATFTIRDVEAGIGATPSTAQIAAILRTTEGVSMVGARRPGVPSTYRKGGRA